MNIFFELADCAVKDFGGKYFALYDTRKSKVMMGSDRYLLINSNRVWAEEDEGVRFIKHRYSEAETTPVDMKEFLWIKLKSQTA